MKKTSTKILVYFVVPVLVGLVINWLTPIKPWSYILSAFIWFFDLLKTEYTLPLWGIILIALAIPILFALVILIFAKKEEKTEPSFHSYTQDNFYGIDWHWSYTGNELYGSSMIPRCPKCKTILQPRNRSGFSGFSDISLKCHNCGFNKDFEVDYDELLLMVRRDIDRKVITEEYKKVQPGSPYNSSQSLRD